MARAERKRIARKLRLQGKPVPTFEDDPVITPSGDLFEAPVGRVRSGKPKRRPKPEK